ncbi:flagellar biosynthesis protein FlhA [Thermodesulfobacterium sp.]|jgi:flagellar biosynthesis protein FlhA|uniref:flagellar biosynthesis protein FlhA n=1 Tax=Thermodesulfobacterium sp. TaxID=1965289 RepID=UPI002649DF06|nr:flagellar biosynthesis protein FlhA [Thermodesulfobacterium sp.]MDN5379650.1 flagellar biosynthesis protein FlhA [Thermodesulfobacterium sp.]
MEKSLIVKYIPDRYSIFAVLGIVVLFAIMLFPLPPYLIDLTLSLNLSVSVLILIMTMQVNKPLDFTGFPALLLLTTLFRLAMNITTTRVILLKGHEGTVAAGYIIKSFGEVVVGGNYIVGFIVFLILVLINFVVITKGAGRIAEVAARFTLDAMPGKQMAIDADLNAGLIDEKEAKRRREEIAKEADFYGAMDGASKFIRGEAIAGLIITSINIIGGILIGTLQKDLDLATSAKTYTILTIGDGLVSQIPALIVSTSAGILVSRAAAEAGLGKDLVMQFAQKPEVLWLASGIVLAIALIPGIPFLPLFIFSVILFSLGYVAYKNQQKVEAEEVAKEEAPQAPPELEEIRPVELLALELGYALIYLADENRGGDLLERIKNLRKHLAQELGIRIPSVHVRDNLSLKPGEYVILIKGVEIAKGELMPNYLMALPSTPDLSPPSGAIPTKEPTFGMTAYFIPEDQKEEAEMTGFTVVTLSTVITTHLSEVVKKHADEFLTKQEVQRILDSVSKYYPKIVEECLNNANLTLIQKVLQNLIKEGIPLKDYVTIFETISDYAPSIKDPDVLTEYVRQKLNRYIVKPYLIDGKLPALVVGDDIEETLRKSLQRTEQGVFLMIDPKIGSKIVAALTQAVERAGQKNIVPVIICSPTIRRHLRKLIERSLYYVPVVSQAEIPFEVQIDVLEVVKIVRD